MSVTMGTQCFRVQRVQEFRLRHRRLQSIDKLLEIAMSKNRNPDGTSVEHPHWKILLNTEVRSIICDDDNARATGVVVRDASGNEAKILLKKLSKGDPVPGSRIVLGAGGVGSPAILMRSEMTEDLKNQQRTQSHRPRHLR